MPLLLGAIVMWSGAIIDIPEGWALCDGSNGTLDLRNRFIIGAGDTYAVGATGGSADAVVVTHSHTGSTSTANNHTHSNTTFGFDFNVALPAFGLVSGSDSTATYVHSHTGTSTSEGESGTNKNLPPYYALAFIQQIE